MYKLPEKDVSGKYIEHIIKRRVQLFRVHPSIELQRCHLHTSHHMHIMTIIASILFDIHHFLRAISKYNAHT